MIIYPKTCENLKGIQNLKPYIKKYKGVEIQMLKWEDDNKLYEIAEKLKNEVEEIEEVTIHPPIKEDYNLEVLTHTHLDREIQRVKLMVDISEKFNLKVNILYHTRWDYNCYKTSGLIDNLKQMLKYTDNTNVKILIENIYSIIYKYDPEIFKIAKEINNENLKICLDTCHLHCQSNMFRYNFEKYMDEYLNINDCLKYVYQIHFSDVLNNDGFIEGKTHGRKHESKEALIEDYKLLQKFEIENKIIVTEIAEEDYSSRKDQVTEIQMLEEILLK